MKFTDAEKAALLAFGAAYPLPENGADENARRVWTLKLAETFKAKFGKWGTKRADENRPPSKDAVAKWVGDRLYSFDTQAANETNGVITLALNPNADGEDITGQVYIEVAAYDWLGEAPPVVVPPVEPTPPEPPASDHEARLSAMEAFLSSTFKAWR